MLISEARLPGTRGLVDVRIGANGRISTVSASGSAASAHRTDPSCPVLHAEGRVLTSGLWDEHVHLGQLAQQAARPDFHDCDSPAEALMRVTKLLGGYRGTGAEQHTAPDELIGVRLRGGEWGGVDRAQLDAVSGTVPVVLLSVDLHGAWLNTAALARYGFDSEHSGHVIEHECFRLTAQLDRVSETELDRRIASVTAAAAALGIVGVVDFEMRWGATDWARRDAAGFAALRVESAIYPQHLELAAARGMRTGSPLGAGGLITVGPLKIVTDGSLGTRTAWCCDPYPDGGNGRELVAPAELRALLTRAGAAGFTAAVHAIGDRANTQALDAFATSGAAGRIEHAQLLRRDDIARFAGLSITASVQPAHLLDDVPSMREVWAERSERAFPFASLMSSGAQLVFGSDAPVAPLDPWLAISAAVTRTRGDEHPWVPSERLGVAAALACSMRGSLRPGPGAAADLVLLDSDPLAWKPAPDSPAPGVAATLVGGNPSYLGDVQLS